MEKNKDISQLARKQRYLTLLKKLKSGSSITKKELAEISKLEKLYKNENKTKKSKPKTKDSNERLPVTVKKMKYLAFVFDTIIEAENEFPSRYPLAEILKKYPQLMAAWERGRYLRDIKNEAESGSSLEQTAHLLKYKNVNEFLKSLESDYEAKSIWNSIRKDRI
jgi:ribosome-binding protein aMBF1 (putative translation factor)